MSHRALLAAALSALVVSGIASAAYVLLTPSTARCAFCPDIPCYGKGGCGRGCVCMKKGMDLEGVCVSVE